MDAGARGHVGERILVADFETTPNVGLFWRAGRKQTILPQSILKERQICVTGYRWIGDAKARSLTWGKDGDEESMVRKAIDLFDQALFIVMHNGDRFDLRWLRGRAMYYRIPMAPYSCPVDPLKVMQRLAYLNSHRLDYLGEFFGMGRKIETSYKLWVKIVTENHQPSLREMARYCRQDVDLLTDFYLEFRSWFPAPPNRTTRNPAFCPHCGSSQTIVNKHRITAAGHDKVQFVCRGCG